jgi:hypothetical protein
VNQRALRERSKKGYRHGLPCESGEGDRGNSVDSAVLQELSNSSGPLTTAVVRGPEELLNDYPFIPSEAQFREIPRTLIIHVSCQEHVTLAFEVEALLPRRKI